MTFKASIIFQKEQTYKQRTIEAMCKLENKNRRLMEEVAL